jgi:predicted DsbA family dithiol-disulfide isomerase
LHPETPEEGLSLKALFANQPVDIGAMMDRLKKTAAELGLPFGDRTMTYNSRLAQELGLWAESRGRGDALHTAAFRAYFVKGQNIARVSVLLELAESAGLERADAEAVLKNRVFKNAVDADWALAYEKQVTAVPTFVMPVGRLVGAQPYEALVQMLTANGVRRRF